ncbi:hypothetical protein [Nocardioides allogilvus]|uniref:hypothetical protein n=1 Tax=Nocardioides allogilvus TaxID=2072017 RepID=UPI00130093B4|nr:hypothetical protein [Nocardioides allogilvus]
MSTTTAPRPRQTTMAGVMVMLASSFVVLSVWDTVSRLRSIETRESIEKFLADAPGSGLDLSVESMIQVLHVLAMIAAVCSVAAVALGWQVLQGSRQARLVLSLLAVPIFLTGLVAGGFMSSVVAIAAGMLWFSPSREWLAGKPIPEPARPLRAEQAPTGTARPELPPTSSTGWSVGAPAPDQRPDPVKVAFVLTVVVAGIVLVLTLVSLALLATQSDLVLEELRRQNPDLEEQGVSESLLLTTAFVSGGLATLWSGLAVVLAVLTARRRAWAAKGLLISSALCAFFCIVAALGSPVALIPALAALTTVSCLRRPDVRAWLEPR